MGIQCVNKNTTEPGNYRVAKLNAGELIPAVTGQCGNTPASRPYTMGERDIAATCLGGCGGNHLPFDCDNSSKLIISFDPNKK
jgi:hypothetical protein